MKALEIMTNTERAKLLHQLMPGSIPDFLRYMKQTADLITGEPEKVKENWNSQLFTVDFWIGLAEHARKKIVLYDKQLVKSSGVFADQLFDGYHAFFAVHCLTGYSGSGMQVQFKEAAVLLFNIKNH
jgi:hypothetical protein